MNPIELETREKGTPFDEADTRRIRALMTEAFPPEQAPAEAEYALFGNDERYHVHVHRGEDGTIDAFATTTDLSDGSLFLCYFATAPNVRGQGLGGRFLDALIEREDDRLLVAEIEPPGSTPMAERRAGFYRRHGMIINDGEYAMPSAAVEGEEVPLLLISHPKALEGAEFERMKALIYQDVYEGYVPLALQ